MNNHKSFLLNYKVLASFALLIPRTALAYPIYVLSSFMLVLDAQNKLRGLVVSVVILALCFVQIALLSFFYKVSYVNMLLDYMQILPFFLIMLMPMHSWTQDSRIIIYVNYAVFILSLLNMTINYGFPMKLPYVHYLPDVISAFWGNGGVKITTVCGFLGLLSLIRNQDERSYIGWFVVIFNFILPSYNIGIACGFAALGYLFARNMSVKTMIRVAVVGFVFFITVIPYIVERWGLLNSTFFDEFGMHPKIYAIYLYVNLIFTDLGVFLFGGGLGNISGTAALWANESLNIISSNTPMAIPGMFESELHQKTIGVALSIIEDQPYAVHSSLNRPYFTIITLFFEFGLIFGAAMLIRFFYSILYGGLDPVFAKVLAIFILVLFFIDNLHANPLFWGLMLVGMRALVGVSKNNVHEVTKC